MKNPPLNEVSLYSKRFFGKQIVISLQNGQMVLMSSEDIELPEIWANKFSVHPADIKHVQAFFYMVLDREPILDAQY
ncbi:SAV0927 family protein [Bacillus sp. FJAT-47783]|uniref:SAV0927 family protein n=1 Tax=Bacillus sp. FJAT-47783 TaxID=2922712 RepID=UPI001FAC02E0|nr:SAV0927 family protein [Bacillus sp. FJAT-47783]